MTADDAAAHGLPAGSPCPADEDAVDVRPARTADVWAIRDLVDDYASVQVLLDKPTVTLFEDVPDFLVAESAGRVVGCGALHILWEDLAEVRTLAVDREWRGRGIGDLLLEGLIAGARRLGVQRVFCLTFAVSFFARHGFTPIPEEPSVTPEVYAELRRSYDEGVAEFLGLERVKPNTLGNTRMLLRL